MYNREPKLGFLTLNQIITGLAAVLVLLSGWLFTLIVDSSKALKDKQIEIIERLARAEANILHNLQDLQDETDEIDDEIDELSDRVSRIHNRK